MSSTDRYWIKTAHKILGPFSDWEVLQIFDSGEYPTGAKISAEEHPNWERKKTLEETQLFKRFPEMRQVLATPTQEYLRQISLHHQTTIAKLDSIHYWARALGVVIVVPAVSYLVAALLK